MRWISSFGKPFQGRLAVLFVLLASAGLTACGGEDGEQVGNKRPFVRLTGGPVDGDSVAYTTEFLWTGWDDDGIIDRYQYAIDIPDDLLDEIDNPEDVGIAWTDTTAFRARFLFTTETQDSAFGAPLDQYRGDHTFFVRAIDNEGGISNADYVGFTARTVTPRSTITVPGDVMGRDLLVVGRQFNLGWQGFDPDNPDPRRQPAYYEWKLKQMPVDWFPSGQNAQYAVDVFAADAPWNRIGVDTTSLRLSLQPPHPYILAVRAVDEAGGVERTFVKGRNALILQALDGNVGRPILTLRERTLGEVVFPGAGITEFEMATNSCVRFEMQADADDYGGVIQGYNYGIDVDPDEDGPTSGFRGWSLNRMTDPICFSTRGIHTVTFKSRDTGGGVTTGTIVLRVVDFTFQRDVLYVDDLRRPLSQGISDAQADQRIIDMIRAGGIDVDDPLVFGQYDAWGPGDAESNPIPLRLSDIGGYKMLLWDTFSTAQNRNSLLVASNACPTGKILQAYVAGGGGLWVWGQQTFGGFDLASGGACFANLNYVMGDGPGLIFETNDFLFEFMKMNGGGIQNIRQTLATHGLVEVNPAPDMRLEGNTTSIGIDRDFYTVSTPINFGDAMFQPTFDPSGGLDTLYTYVAIRTISPAHNRPNAFRYADPNPIPSQGPVAVFGFPLHFLQQGSAEQRTGTFGMARTMLEWLRRHHDRYIDSRSFAVSGEPSR
jgi:hypothetical protein